MRKELILVSTLFLLHCITQTSSWITNIKTSHSIGTFKSNNERRRYRLLSFDERIKRNNIITCSSLVEKNLEEAEDIVKEIVKQESVKDTNNIQPKINEESFDNTPTSSRREIELSWCNREGECYINTLREISDSQNRISFQGPATGQVNYRYKKSSSKVATVLLLVKRNEDDLIQIAVNAIQSLISLCDENGFSIKILIQEELAQELHGISSIDIFQPITPPGYSGFYNHDISMEDIPTNSFITPQSVLDSTCNNPDLVCTLGGDGLLMFASSLFPASVPPILAVTGGTMGFLTKFESKDIVDSIVRTLGLHNDNTPISVSMRMRLECRILNKDGQVRARYNVLNEVTIDRGSSPYLSNLECFVDDVHLTTVQADGIIFATPTGSTAYSMAAGGSVVHPAVPCILVTPICPHVLSFRSMIFPDHVILRCYVPDDARAESASVAFDGKHHHDLHRGESVQIQMSMHPVPTINRFDHSSDWLDGLHTSFNFNSRVKQKPFPNKN